MALDYAQLERDAQAGEEAPPVKAEVDGTKYTLTPLEAATVTEIIFQPRLHNSSFHEVEGLGAALVSAARAWFVDPCVGEGKLSIMLAGGSSALPGLAPRLEREMRTAFEGTALGALYGVDRSRWEVLPAPDGGSTAWLGGVAAVRVPEFGLQCFGLPPRPSGSDWSTPARNRDVDGGGGDGGDGGDSDSEEGEKEGEEQEGSTDYPSTDALFIAGPSVWDDESE